MGKGDKALAAIALGTLAAGIGMAAYSAKKDREHERNDVQYESRITRPQKREKHDSYKEHRNDRNQKSQSRKIHVWTTIGI